MNGKTWVGVVAALALSVMSGCDREQTSTVVVASGIDPHDGVGATSDASINGQVEALIRGEPLLDGMPIAVSTHDATVTLHGTVTSLQVAQLAAVLAAEVEGVREVVNRLRVSDDG